MMLTVMQLALVGFTRTCANFSILQNYRNHSGHPSKSNVHIFSLGQSTGRNVFCTCSEDALCIFTFHSLRLKSFFSNCVNSPLITPEPDVQAIFTYVF